MKTLRKLMFGCLALMVALSMMFVSCSDDDDDDDNGGVVTPPTLTINTLKKGDTALSADSTTHKYTVEVGDAAVVLKPTFKFGADDAAIVATAAQGKVTLSTTSSGVSITGDAKDEITIAANTSAADISVSAKYQKGAEAAEDDPTVTITVTVTNPGDGEDEEEEEEDTRTTVAAPVLSASEPAENKVTVTMTNYYATNVDYCVKTSTIENGTYTALESQPPLTPLTGNDAGKATFEISQGYEAIYVKVVATAKETSETKKGTATSNVCTIAAKPVAATVRGTTGVIDDFFGYPLDSAQLQGTDIKVGADGKVTGTLKKASFAGLKTLKGGNGNPGVYDVFLTDHNGVNEQSGFYICLDTKTKTNGDAKDWENAYCFFLGVDAATAKAKSITLKSAKIGADADLTLDFSGINYTGTDATAVKYEESTVYRATYNDDDDNDSMVGDFFGYACDSTQFAEDDVKIWSNGVVTGTLKKVSFAGLKTLTGSKGEPGSWEIFHSGEDAGYYLCLDKKNGNDWENAYCFFVSADGSTKKTITVDVGDGKTMTLDFTYTTFATADGDVPKVKFAAAMLPKADGANSIGVTNVVLDEGEDLLGKAVSDLVDGDLTFTVEKDDDGKDVITVAGTLKNIGTAWTKFSGSDNTGYFVPLMWGATGATKVVFLDDDKKALTGPGSKSIELTADKDGNIEPGVQIIRVTNKGGDDVDTSKTVLIGFGDEPSEGAAYTNYATLDFSGCKKEE